MKRYIFFLSWMVIPAILLAGPCAAAPAAGQPQPPDLNVLRLPEWPVTMTAGGGKLLLSDSPETVNDEGILYQDLVEGSARLFFHHVNGTKAPKKVVVLLENQGPETAHLTVTNSGLGGPGPDYLAVGKAAQEQYMKGGNLYLVEVPENGTAELVPELSGITVPPEALVNGIYDFTTDRPVMVKVMLLADNADPVKFARTAPVLPADQYRLRGTFAGRDRLVTPVKTYDSAKDGPVVMTLADNKIDDYATGIDATDGSRVLNYGNYGIVYRLYLPSLSAGGAEFYLNPRGGIYAGVMGVEYRHRSEFAVGTPEGRLFFGADKKKDFAYLGTYEGGQSLWFTFSPPGASNLPVKLLVVPKP